MKGGIRGAVVIGLAASLAAAGSPEVSPIAFEDVTKRAGIAFRIASDLRRGKSLAVMGGGLALGDFDGDSHLDLFLAGSVANGKRPEAGPCGALYRNRGDGTFEDVTAAAKVDACGWSAGAAFVDLEGRGRLDLLVTGLGRVLLFRNLGDGTFHEEAAARGLVVPLWSVGLAAGDVNADGRVDLYVVNYLDTDYERETRLPALEIRVPESYAGQDARLFLQREDGTFRDATAASGAANRDGRGLQAVAFDYDADGRTDLYVTNDRTSNRLYRGNGNGTFEDVTVEAGAGQRDLRQAPAGMGVTAGDADGDGHPDLVVTNFAGEPCTFYRSVAGELFDDATESSGVAAGSRPLLMWGIELADLDDDGWPDLPAVSGHLVPRWLVVASRLLGKGEPALYRQGNRSYAQPAKLWRNLGEGRFEDVTATAGDLSRLELVGRGLAAGDVDGDGRLDLAIGVVSGRPRLLRNVTPAGGNALEVLLVAGKDGRTVLGTKIAVEAGGRRQVQEVLLRSSYASQSWTPLHFGLGEATEALVEVIPPGAVEPTLRFPAVAARTLWELRDGRLRELRRLHRRSEREGPVGPGASLRGPLGTPANAMDPRGDPAETAAYPGGR